MGKSEFNPRKRKRLGRRIVIVLIAFWCIAFFVNRAVCRKAYTALLDGDLRRAERMTWLISFYEPVFFLNHRGMGRAGLRRAFRETDEQIKEARLKFAIETGGSIVSPPAGADGMVYFGNNADMLYKVRADTGGVVWRYRAGGDIEAKPLTADGKVFAAAHDGIHAVDDATGKRIWH
ncbi:MAG: PQQ-binding-like beta-propeller repeat protein, partial [bacterium]